MIAYLDSSVVMGILLGQTPPPAQWEAIQRNVSSSLLVVECLRVLDRFRLTREMPADELEVRKTDLRILLRQIQLLPIDEATLDLAA